MARYDQTVPLEEGDRPRSGQGETQTSVAGEQVDKTLWCTAR